MTRPLLAVASLLLAASFAAPCAAQQELPLVRTWRVGPMPVIVVRGDDVRVRVRPGAPDTVRLVMKHVVKGGGWRYEERPSAMSATQDGDTIRIEARSGGGTVVVGAGAERFELRLWVPPGCLGDFETGEGAVDLAHVAGRFRVRTLTGDLRARAVAGPLDFQSLHSGDVRVRDHEGPLDAWTGSGRVEARGRFDAVHLTSGGSRMELDVAPGSRFADDWKLVMLGRPASRSHLALRVPSALDARISVTALSAECVLPAARIERLAQGALLATLGSGHGRVQCLAPGSDVRILPSSR